MISRYSRKELVKIWSEENKYKIWLDIEVAAAQAMEKYRIIPKGVSSIVRKKGKIRVKRIQNVPPSIFLLLKNKLRHTILVSKSNRPLERKILNLF